MSILDNLAARFGYMKAQPPRPPDDILSIADGYRWEMPNATEAEKQMRLYAALTWIATAIDIPAGIAAGSVGTFHVRKIAGEPDGPDDEEITNHPYELLLRKPNPMQSGGEFLRDCYTMFKTTGNLYRYLNAPSETAPPDEVWIIPSHMIRPIPDGQSYISGYELLLANGKTEFIPPWKIVHTKTSNPLNPFVGLSALQSLALDAYGDIAQQKWNLSHFDKNNAKLPTILAFKQMVADPEWKKIKAERDTEWGGVNRSGVTLLRGVGDALQVLQASATQKDMEFLESRNFAKEEIYGKLAPGLASILAVNATEANAIAGKATLLDFCIFPFLSQMAEKDNAVILPLYGDDLLGEYDDVRQTNRILDLQEQQEYAKYHTINEVRAEYYDEGPLELDPDIVLQMPEEPITNLDPRGFLFPAQISPNTPNPADVAPPEPEMEEPLLEAEPPLFQPEGDALPEPALPMDTPAIQAELKAWQNFALKRLGKPAGREFEPRVIDVFTAGRIRTALKSARTDGDVRRIFGQYDSDMPTAKDVQALTEQIKQAVSRLDV